MKMRIGAWTPRVGGVRRRTLRLGDYQAVQIENMTHSWVEATFDVPLESDQFDNLYNRLYKGLAWFRDFVESREAQERRP